MNKPTPGIWKRFYEFIEDDKGNTIISCSGENTESEQDEANATFVVAAHAACRSINPSNPLAVAEALPQLIWVLRNLENDDGSIPSTIWNVRNAALAKLEGKL